MLSNHMTTKLSRNGWRNLLIRMQNVVDELVRTNNITRNSKDLYLVTHVVFDLSPLAIPRAQVKFGEYLALLNWSKRFIIKGID